MRKKLTCRSSFASTTTTPSSHPACPTPQRSMIREANSAAASLAEAEEASERSRRPSAASATWKPACCPHDDFANGFFACAMSRRVPSISSAAALDRMRSGSQSQLGLPAGLLQAARSTIGLGKSLPDGENDERASSPSSVIAAQRPRRPTQQSATTTATNSVKAKPPPRRRKERRIPIVARSKCFFPDERKKSDVSTSERAQSFFCFPSIKNRNAFSVADERSSPPPSLPSL